MMQALKRIEKKLDKILDLMKVNFYLKYKPMSDYDEKSDIFELNKELLMKINKNIESYLNKLNIDIKNELAKKNDKNYFAD